MLGGGKTRWETIYRRWFAAGLGAVVFSTLITLLPSPAHAQCGHWDVSGEWEIQQSNATRVALVLSVNGNKITGTARESRNATIIPVTGTFEGNKFNMTIYWQGGYVGVYRGTVDAGGGMTGTTHSKNFDGARATWYSMRSMVCADADIPQPAPDTAPPRPPPIKSSGKTKIDPTPRPIKSSGKAKTSTASPTISANPIAVTIPEGQTHGRTTLTWDAGPDHPDAEVWMKDMQGEERLVVRQGKGTRSVTVELGKNYQIILTDAGQQLAKAAVLTRQ
jgi:hypothetical protein